MEGKRNRQGKKRLYQILYRLTIWGGFALVGLFALPAGLLGLLASGVWNAADRLATWLERKEEQ